MINITQEDVLRFVGGQIVVRNEAARFTLIGNIVAIIAGLGELRVGCDLRRLLSSYEVSSPTISRWVRSYDCSYVVRYEDCFPLDDLKLGKQGAEDWLRFNRQFSDGNDDIVVLIPGTSVRLNRVDATREIGIKVAT